VTTLRRARPRTIAVDNRGHGASTKVYDPALYIPISWLTIFARCLTISVSPRADVMVLHGGSQHRIPGARYGERVRSAILGGLGIHLVEDGGLPGSIAAALEAPSVEDVTDPQGRMFRVFADQTKSDAWRSPPVSRFAQSLSPSEVAADRGADVDRGRRQGTNIAGSAHELAALVPGARALVFRAAIICCRRNRVFKGSVLRFLERAAVSPHHYLPASEGG